MEKVLKATGVKQNHITEEKKIKLCRRPFSAVMTAAILLTAHISLKMMDHITLMIADKK